MHQTRHEERLRLPQEGLETLYGAHDGNLKHIESLLGVQIRTHGDELIVEGDKAAEQRVERLFDQLVGLIADGYELSNGDVKTAVQLVANDENVDLRDYFLREGQKQPEGTRRRVNPKSTESAALSRRHRALRHRLRRRSRGNGQDLSRDGAGRQLSAREEGQPDHPGAARSRSGREARASFPAICRRRSIPYLRPLYDALYDMMDTERATRLVERGTIEVAPIAFMRGRTLNDAFVILDEAQNTTSEQMKMFLTRLGFGSKAVVTGDITQIDLPHPKHVGARRSAAGS